MVHKGDSDTSWGWCTWNNPQRFGKGIEDLEIRGQVETIQHYCYIVMQNHNDTNNKDTGRLLYKYKYLSLYCKGWKRVTRGLRVRGSWRLNINCNILTPLLWPSVLYLSRSDAQPEALGSTFLGDCFFTASYQQLLWTPTHQGPPRAPSAWCGFPYHISSITHLVSNWNFCLDWVI